MDFRSGVPRFMKRSYGRFSYVGWSHIVLGVLALVCGTVDIAWTVAKYDSSCTHDDVNDDVDVCGGTHVYTYVAAPIWGGIVMICCGAMGMWMTPLRITRQRRLPEVFGGLCVLLLLVCFAIIALQVEELIHGEGHFYINTNDGIEYVDVTKFVLTTSLAVIGSMDVLACIVSLLMLSQCRPTIPKRAADWAVQHPGSAKAQPEMSVVPLDHGIPPMMGMSPPQYVEAPPSYQTLPSLHTASVAPGSNGAPY